MTVRSISRFFVSLPESRKVYLSPWNDFSKLAFPDNSGYNANKRLSHARDGTTCWNSKGKYGDFSSIVRWLWLLSLCCDSQAVEAVILVVRPTIWDLLIKLAFYRPILYRLSLDSFNIEIPLSIE